MPSLSSSFSLMRWILSFGSTSISSSFPVNVFTLINMLQNQQFVTFGVSFSDEESSEENSTTVSNLVEFKLSLVRRHSLQLSIKECPKIYSSLKAMSSNSSPFLMHRNRMTIVANPWCMVLNPTRAQYPLQCHQYPVLLHPWTLDMSLRLLPSLGDPFVLPLAPAMIQTNPHYYTASLIFKHSWWYSTPYHSLLFLNRARYQLWTYKDKVSDGHESIQGCG